MPKPQHNPPPMPHSKLFNVKQTAKYLGVSVPTIWRLGALGQLPKPLHVGKAARWPIATLDAWLDEQTKLAATLTKQAAAEAAA